MVMNWFPSFTGSTKLPTKVAPGWSAMVSPAFAALIASCRLAPGGTEMTFACCCPSADTVAIATARTAARSAEDLLMSWRTRGREPGDFNDHATPEPGMNARMFALPPGRVYVNPSRCPDRYAALCE